MCGRRVRIELDLQLVSAHASAGRGDPAAESAGHDCSRRPTGLRRGRCDAPGIPMHRRRRPGRSRRHFPFTAPPPERRRRAVERPPRDYVQERRGDRPKSERSGRRRSGSPATARLRPRFQDQGSRRHSSRDWQGLSVRLYVLFHERLLQAQLPTEVYAADDLRHQRSQAGVRAQLLQPRARHVHDRPQRGRGLLHGHRLERRAVHVGLQRAN